MSEEPFVLIKDRDHRVFIAPESKKREAEAYVDAAWRHFNEPRPVGEKPPGRPEGVVDLGEDGLADLKIIGYRIER